MLGRVNLQTDATMPRVVRRLAHKGKPANLCVATPLQIDENRFRLDLHFSASNEFFTLLSGSADFIVAPLAAEIDADHIYAVTLEIDDAGRCTCRRLPLPSRMEHHEQDNEQVFP